MIAGRKLLLADDSIAIQKVIDLTFTDEGMEVTTVGDGQDALEKLDQFTPDVVLADIYMPGVGGYELCKFIKQQERFRSVPVMLLVGSFEPFDEAEARRAGADDVVTKPFQSIRDLVSRVGSLVRRDSRAMAEDAPAPDAVEQAEVKVFVEAPSMEPDKATVLVEAPMMDVEPAQMPEHECPPVIDLQTADTRRLEPVLAAAPPPVAEEEVSEAIELQVVEEEPVAAEEMAPVVSFAPHVEVAEKVKFDDEGVLDLGDIDSFAAAGNDDEFELDVEVEPVSISAAASMPDRERLEFEVDQPQESAPVPVAEPANPESGAVQDFVLSHSGELSPDAIDQISKRVVEQLSDKVVREIAWEVVPELSELLIKRQLEEKR